jgi:hypothetical protein
MQSRKMFQVLIVAVLCTVVFVVAAFAGDREDRKGNREGKAPHQIVIQKVGPVGHWTPIKSFHQTVPSPFGKALDSCSGSCNCSTCSCYGTYSCCSAGCGACFDVACNASV